MNKAITISSHQPVNSSLFRYIIIMVSLSLYLFFVTYDLEYFYFLGVFGVLILFTALVNIEISMLFVPFVLCNALPLKETGTNLILSEYVLLIIFGVSFVRLCVSSERRTFPKEFVAPIALLIISGIISWFVSQHFSESVKQVVRYVEVLIVFLFLVVNTFTSEDSIKRVIVFLIGSGCVASAVGIYQYIGNISAYGGAGRVFGLLGGGYGAVLSSTIVLSVGILLYEAKLIYKMFSVIAIALSGFALVLNQTRAWIGSLFVVFFLLMLFSHKKMVKRFVVTSLSMVIVVGILFVTNFFGIIDKNVLGNTLLSAFRFGVRAGEYSVADLSLFLRYNVWSFSFEKFFQNPIFGIGLGNLRFADYFPPRLGAPGEGMGYVDNQYLQVFVETGIIGGIAWIMLVSQAVRIGVRTLKGSFGSRLSSVSFGLFGSVLVFIVGSFFWVVTPFHEVFALMMLYLGLLFCVFRMLQTESPSVVQKVV